MLGPALGMGQRRGYGGSAKPQPGPGRASPRSPDSLRAGDLYAYRRAYERGAGFCLRIKPHMHRRAFPMPYALQFWYRPQLIGLPRASGRPRRRVLVLPQNKHRDATRMRMHMPRPSCACASGCMHMPELMMLPRARVMCMMFTTMASSSTEARGPVLVHMRMANRPAP